MRSTTELRRRRGGGGPIAEGFVVGKRGVLRTPERWGHHDRMGDTKAPPSSKSPADSREARLAAALRGNLKRRKAAGAAPPKAGADD